jgi:hypothetical protein
MTVGASIDMTMTACLIAQLADIDLQDLNFVGRQNGELVLSECFCEAGYMIGAIENFDLPARVGEFVSLSE